MTDIHAKYAKRKLNNCQMTLSVLELGFWAKTTPTPGLNLIFVGFFDIFHANGVVWPIILRKISLWAQIWHWKCTSKSHAGHVDMSLVTFGRCDLKNHVIPQNARILRASKRIIFLNVMDYIWHTSVNTHANRWQLLGWAMWCIKMIPEKRKIEQCLS